MNRIMLIVTFFFAITASILSQPKIGTITGSIIDKSNSRPLENADVTLLRLKDSSVVKGTSTDASGKFTLAELPPGKFILRANVVGYNFAIVNGITINKDNPSVELDPIRLSQGETSTEEIVVEGEKSTIEFHPDKKVFNFDKNITTQGSTLIDLLKNIPGINVDQDGNVSFRGGEGIKIMIDGKTFGLEGNNRNIILEQIPASNVTSVELITNPSAKYEAEGSYGIINVILKKNSGNFGYNGSLGLNMGTGDKYNGHFNLNLKNNKFSVIGNYSYNLMNFTSTGYSDRYNYISSSISRVYQNSSGSWRNKGHMLKLGFDYTINQMNSFGMTFNYRNSTRSRDDNSLIEQFDNSGNISSSSTNVTDNTDDGYDLDVDATYLLRLKNKGQQLQVDLSYSRDKEDEFSYIYEIPGTPVNNTPDKRNETTNDKNNNYTGQADYVHPFGKDAKLETGYKGSYKKRESNYLLELFNYNTGQFETDLNQSNTFNYSEQVQAFYAIYTNKIGDFGFSLGPRVEYTKIKGELINTNETFDKNYIDIFPSASISQKIAKGSEIQLSYSRRINRPRMRMLNPFKITSMGSTINIFQGNPNLNPEYADSYEFSFIQYLPWATITPSIFYKYNRDQISRSRSLVDSITTLTTFVNYNNVRSYGGELIVNAQPFRFWSLNGQASYFKTEVDANNLQSGLTNSGYSWSTRFMTSFNLPANIFLQITYFYSGKRISAQGTMQPYQSLDGAIKKDLFDKRLSISLRVNDILDQAKMRMEFNDPEFSEIAERRRDSRTVSLNLTYNFGQKDDKMDKRKKKKTDDNNNNGDDDIGF